jgi:aspartate aminotransferase
MFEHLNSQPTDKIMELMAQYAEDTRTNKLDLGVGVYKNAEGATPIMKAVKKKVKRYCTDCRIVKVMLAL